MRNVVIPILLMFAMLFPFVNNVQAIDLSVGALCWYSQWDYSADVYDKKYTIDTAPIYGPVLSLTLGSGWSISTLFLYGTYNTTDELVRQQWPSRMKRYDSDTLINYSIHRYVKIFLGGKYMGYNYAEGKNYAYGPGLGLGITVPLVHNIYFLCNASLLYLKGNESFKRYDSGGESDSDLSVKGYNANASLAYYINPVTISIGYRYQFFETDYKAELSEGFSDSKMSFFGVTLSAIYSFEI